ncbi:MAG: hypothetical protein KDB22_17875 [Planctomycetales bacterium]|nr:hypothetical protein [Planctomycetales bacterium]
MVWKAGQQEPRTPATETKTDPVRVLSIYSQPESEPNLKYRFYESAVLRQSGSSSDLLGRARLVNLQIPNAEQLNKQYAQFAEQWSEGPVEELLTSGAVEYLESYEQVLKLVHAATRLSRVEPIPTVEFEGEELELNAEEFGPIQDYRHFARLLVLQARVALAEGRLDDALDSIGSGFRLAEICELQQPALVSKLVALAIVGLMHISLEELVQHPDCPNLYWALASVPDSFWSCSIALDGELAYQDKKLGSLMRPVPLDASREEIVQRLVQTITIMPVVFDAGSNLDRTTAQLLAGIAILLFADNGREELREFGYSPQQIAQLSPPAVVILSTQLSFSQARDRVFKWALLENQSDRIEKELSAPFQSVRIAARPTQILNGMLLPAIQALQSAVLRSEMTHKRLMFVEALRAHAAFHNELPQTMSDLDVLPAPLNPQTSKPFQYDRLAPNRARIVNLPTYSADRQTETNVNLRSR